jgi:uncharacterized protein YukE
MAAKVHELESHLNEAKKTLETHKDHIKQVEETVAKAEGAQKLEL